MSYKKLLTFLFILILLFTFIPFQKGKASTCSKPTSYAGVFTSYDKFKEYVKSAGYPDSINVFGVDKDGKTGYYEFYPNFTTYQNYDGDIVYGNQINVIGNEQRTSACTGKNEWRYLGFTSGGQPYDNNYFPNVQGTTTPDKFDYINVFKANSSWENIAPNIISFMRTAQLTGNGAESIPGFNVNYINNKTPTSDPLVNDGSNYWYLSKTLVESTPSWRNQFTIYTANKGSNGRTYYATFNGPAFGQVSVKGTITTPSNTYTINANQSQITIPGTLTATASMQSPAVPSQIQELTANFDSTHKTSYFKKSGVTPVTTVSTNKDFVLKRSDYTVGTHTITLTGTVKLTSVLSASDVFQNSDILTP